MPKAAKKKAPAQSEDVGTILEQLGMGDGPDKSAPPAWQKDFETLQNQLRTMESQLRQANETNLALMSKPAGNEQPQIKAPDGLSMEGMPDPILDSDGFGKELNRRIAASMQSQQQYQAAVQQAQARPANQASDLWDDFTTQHPDYAQHEDRMEFAAEKVAKKLQKKGVDVPKYMNVAREQFFAAVIKEHDDIFGPLEGSDEGNEPAPVVSKHPNEEPHRTVGIFGGYESGGEPAKAPGPKSGDLVSDLEAIQQKIGIF